MEQVMWLIGFGIPGTITFYTDIKGYKIYDRVVLFMLIAGMIRAFALSAVGDAMVGILAGFSIVFICAWFGGVGGGDVKFSAALGVWFGTDVLYVLAAGGILSFIVGLIKMARYGLLKSWAQVLFRGLYLRLVYRNKQGLVFNHLPVDVQTPNPQEVVPLGCCFYIAAIGVWIYNFSSWIGG